MVHFDSIRISPIVIAREEDGDREEYSEVHYDVVTGAGYAKSYLYTYRRRIYLLKPLMYKSLANV
jgi:hypothetical protein